MSKTDFEALEAFGDAFNGWGQPRSANVSSIMNSLFISGRTLDARPRIDDVPVMVAAMFDDDTPTIYTTKATSPRRSNVEQAIGVAHVLLQMRDRLPDTPCRQFLEPHFDLLPTIGDGKARWVAMMTTAKPSAQLADIAAVRLATAIVMPRVRFQNTVTMQPDEPAADLQRRCNLFLPDTFVAMRCKSLRGMAPLEAPVEQPYAGMEGP